MTSPATNSDGSPAGVDQLEAPQGTGRAPHAGTPPRPRARRGRPGGSWTRELSARTRFLVGAASVLVLVVAWQVVSDLELVDPVFSSSPTAVVAAARQMLADGVLQPAVASSLQLFVAGFAVSLVLGIVLGVLLGSLPLLDAALDPLISFLYAAPRIALVPLVMLWAGIGFESRIVMVVISGVFPILINVASGVRAIDRQLVAMTKSFGGNHRQLLRWVAIPGAVPAIVAGVRQGVAMCLIGVVIAEYFIGGTGVGGLIVTAGQTLNTAQAYVGVILFAVTAIVLTALLRVVERRLDAWRA